MKKLLFMSVIFIFAGCGKEPQKISDLSERDQYLYRCEISYQSATHTTFGSSEYCECMYAGGETVACYKSATQK